MSYLVSLHIPCLPFTFSSVPADTIRFTPGRHGDDDEESRNQTIYPGSASTLVT